MSPRYTLAASAQRDIEHIIDFIAQDNLQAAFEFEADLYRAFDLLVETPQMGHLKPDWTSKPYRFWVVRKRYLIIYAAEQPLRILRIMNDYQDIAAQLHRE